MTATAIRTQIAASDAINSGGIGPAQRIAQGMRRGEARGGTSSARAADSKSIAKDRSHRISFQFLWVFGPIVCKLIYTNNNTADSVVCPAQSGAWTNSMGFDLM